MNMTLLKTEACRLAAQEIRKGFVLNALHEYYDIAGTIGYVKIRLQHPETGKKWLRPMHLKNERYVLGEPVFPDGKPLYRLLDLTARRDTTVIICEGETCVDALHTLGVLATTSGSADSARSAHWQPLAGRAVILWPDNDSAGYRYMTVVADILKNLGCSVCWVDVAVLHLPPKGDVVDWLNAHPTATAESIARLPKLERIPLSLVFDTENQDHLDSSQEKTRDLVKQTQASLVVAFVNQHVDLFHDNHAVVYACDKRTQETRRLEGRQFKDWSVAHFYAATGKSIRDQAMREALSTLGGLAKCKGNCQEVHIRVAQQGETYFLDLGEPGQSRAVEINPGAWKIVSEPPVRFLRPETLRPLPEPIPHGKLAALWLLMNIPEHSQLLVIAWLCECLRPDTPFPLLEFIGEQGSAKSTTQTLLRRLLDPNACDLRASPKTVEDIFVSAGVNWIVSYENISHLSAAMQDAFCVLATGGGYAKRKLYSDADESIIVVKRPTVLNGISAAITAQDLIDRTLSIETPVVTRRTEMTDLWRTYEKEHGNFLGGFIDYFCRSLS